MNPIMAALVVALLASVGINALQFSTIGELRESVGELKQSRDTAQESARSCSTGVARLQEAAKRQAEAVAKAIEQARQEGLQAGRRAGAERNRPQAVPGDACASAAIETREWLQRRQGGAQ